MQLSALGSFRSTDRFALRSLLGRGFSGLVYRAYDREMGTDVAIKTLDMRGADKLYRLRREFRARQKLSEMRSASCRIRADVRRRQVSDILLAVCV